MYYIIKSKYHKLKRGDLVSFNKASTMDRNDFIEQSMPFIIKTTSSFLGRYVCTDNDEEFSIALIAFNEAIEKYNEDRGNFWAFAKLVIESRLKNNLRKNARIADSSLEELTEGGMQIKDVGVTVDKTTSDLRDEILAFKKELEQFDITFEILAEKSPKHKDTRDRAIRIGYRVSDDGVLIEKVYEKKRLPIRDISRKFEITEKILKRSKVFILSTAVLFFKKYTNLIVWIKGVK